ncbi:hypothetical protein HPB50_018666 [Hyalomma asiaticum]|uniref:Uncharacterized protein n=1 Tax=Hyalomma asiaticum TaxID=266040 RepID=A0ACB7SGZ0_HYAAI|nr:hypothetical protein HPB50_018666 [Hyalomma asiaticum]
MDGSGLRQGEMLRESSRHPAKRQRHRTLPERTAGKTKQQADEELAGRTSGEVPKPAAGRQAGPRGHRRSSSAPREHHAGLVHFHAAESCFLGAREACAVFLRSSIIGSPVPRARRARKRSTSRLPRDVRSKPRSRSSKDPGLGRDDKPASMLTLVSFAAHQNRQHHSQIADKFPTLPPIRRHDCI